LKNLRVYTITTSLKKNKIHELVKSLCKELNFSVSNLEINFISSRSIIEINKKYLNHNYSTDIITFNYSNVNELIDGEIFISIDEALNNAKKFRVKSSDEFARLVIHGILHLLGYDDLKYSDKKIMKRLENKLLSKNNFILLW
jgi:rRNA maturation RNase YbeY